MNKTTLKRYIIFLVGLFAFGLGVSLGNKSLLGGNPMSVFVVGLSKHLPFTIGTCNMIVGIVEVVIGYILDKSNISFATFIGTFFGSYCIDLGNLIFKDTTDLSIKIIYMIAGMIMYCLGLALQQYAHCGLGNLDCYNFGLKKALKIKDYHTVRWITDAIFIVLGYLLGGIVGVGTVILILIAGTLIENFKKIITGIFGAQE